MPQDQDDIKGADAMKQAPTPGPLSASGYEKSDRRNHAGVKNSADLYRTFNGAHYVQWEIEPTAEYIAALRAAGVRCRRVKDDLFVHHEDQALAGPVPGAH